jgi:hypothetical protein
MEIEDTSQHALQYPANITNMMAPGISEVGAKRQQLVFLKVLTYFCFLIYLNLQAALWYWGRLSL